MKKIVFLATHIGLINRGAETFVIEIVKKLSKDYKVEVYSKGISEEIKDFIIPVNFKVPKILKVHDYFYNKFTLFRKICDRLHYLVPSVIEQYFFNKVVYQQYLKNRSDIDLIFPNNGIWGVKVALQMRKKYKTPFIYTGHGGIGSGERLILEANPNKYIALNPIHQMWCNKYSKNIVLIPNGVDLDKFKVIDRKNDELIVLCVGAFVEFKRQKLLIDAVKELNYGRLILLGSGELYDDLQSYGARKLGDRFEIRSVKYEEVLEYYQLATVFSLPSREEPFGIVYLEAMATNLPIVATNDKSREYIIGECGVLCDVENSKDYANSIQKASKMKINGRKRVEKLFSWDVTVRKYIEVIEEVMAK